MSTQTETLAYLHFDGMTWPNPTYIMEDDGLAWRLRYGHATKQDLNVAASALSAYAMLIDLPPELAADRIARIRKHDGR